MNHRMYSQLIAIVVGSVLLVSLCGSITRADSQQPEPVKLKVLFLSYLSFAPFFIAEEEGYFAEQSIEIESIKRTGSADALSALLQGDLDVLAGGIRAAHFNAIARGGTIKLVADKGHVSSAKECSDHVILARRDLVQAGKMEDPAQLQDLRIEMDSLTFSGYFMETVLQKAGVTLDDVEVKNLPAPTVPEALKTGPQEISGECDLTAVWNILDVRTFRSRFGVIEWC